MKLEIFNVMGQKVAVVVNAYYEPGRYTIEWNGKTDFGNMIASGVYFARLIAGEHSASKKMVVVR